jgi:hypothetical protein
MVDYHLPLTQSQRQPLVAEYQQAMQIRRQKAMFENLTDRVMDQVSSFLGEFVMSTTQTAIQDAVNREIDKWWEYHLSSRGPIAARIKFQIRVEPSQHHTAGYDFRYSPALELLAMGNFNREAIPGHRPTDEVLVSWVRNKE